VVPHKGLGVLCVRILYEGADSRPGSEDVAAVNSNVGGDIALDFREYPIYLLFAREWVWGYCSWCVGGAGNGVALPREEEDNASIGGVGVNKALDNSLIYVVQDATAGRVGYHPLGRKVSRENDMHTTAWCNNFLCSHALVELPDRVCEGSCSVDDTLTTVN